VTATALLVLGSGSPRRREILETLRVPHVVFTASIDERMMAGEDPDAYLARVVSAKLAAVRRALPTELREQAAAILVADTAVILRDAVLGASILGKPDDTADAARTILRLSGRTHDVCTRYALASVDAAGPSAFLDEETVTTRVTFRELTPERALAYAATGEGMDKAGAYAVQGMGAALVSRIEGSYSNVVGLPACEVSLALERRGIGSLG
jgi:septum formation protein